MMGEWYRSNGHNESTAPDRNTHEGACSGDWTLGMISDELKLPQDIKPGKCAHWPVSWPLTVLSLTPLVTVRPTAYHDCVESEH